MAITKVGDDAVSVTIEEIKPDDWGEKVYKPDIVNGAGKIVNRHRTGTLLNFDICV